ncbi:MAG: hypothetical protein WB562_16870 [Candidatus Sulfotelmatobacter sp.]
MKKLVGAMLVVLTMMLAGCGSNSHATGNINGNWAATLNSSGTETFAFTTLLTVNAGGSLGSTNFILTLNNSSCGFPATTESGSFMFMGNFSGQVSGAFQYTITSTGAEVNTLSLNGTVNNGQITGTWTLSGAGSGCSGNGTFSMTPAAG